MKNYEKVTLKQVRSTNPRLGFMKKFVSLPVTVRKDTSCFRTEKCFDIFLSLLLKSLLLLLFITALTINTLTALTLPDNINRSEYVEQVINEPELMNNYKGNIDNAYSYTIVEREPSLEPKDLVACVRCQYVSEIRHDESQQKTPPEIIQRTPPDYPPELHIFEGTVIIEVTVLPDSTIGYLEVKESAGMILDSLAIETVKEWEFAPAFRNDEPVVDFLEVDIDFIPDEYEPVDEVEEVFTEEELRDLKKEIEEYQFDHRRVKKHSLYRMPYPFYSENYHIYSHSRKYPIIRRNGFTLLPGYTTASHVLQNEVPFFEDKINRYQWKFYTQNYPFQVTLTEAHLGLGYLDMDYGHVTLRKNNLFELEGLQLNTGYIVEDGYWMGAYEEKSNFSADLYYRMNNYAFRWNIKTIRQQIPSTKLRFLDSGVGSVVNNNGSPVPVDEYVDEHSFYFTNPYLDLGLRYEKLSYKFEDKSPQRSLWQINLNRSFTLYDHSLQLQWEVLQAKESGFTSVPFLTTERDHVITFNYDLNTNPLYLNLKLMRGLGYDYYNSSEAGIKFGDKVRGGIGYMENERKDVDDILYSLDEQSLFTARQYYHQCIARDIYSTFTLQDIVLTGRKDNGERRLVLSDAAVTAGKQQLGQASFMFSRPDTTSQSNISISSTNSLTKEELDTFYLRTDYQIDWMIGNTEWSLYGYGQYYFDNENMWFLPQYFTRNAIECSYLLPHDNMISAGLIHHFVSAYEPEAVYSNETSILDAFLRISLTPLFDIQADVKNILESESLFGLPNRAGIHMNVGIRWMFFN